MVRTQDGFEIAEVDLKLRGPGNLLGTQQSGALLLQIANIVKDKDILSLARYEAQLLVRNDALMTQKENLSLRKAYDALVKHKNIWKYIS